MTKFDIIVGAMLLISAGFGFARGAAREVAALVALVAAAVVAIVGLPLSTPLVGKAIHSEWMAAIAALIVVFVVTYLILRLTLGAMASRVHDTEFLGTLDRSVGLLIGMARGLLVLGVLNLAFKAATPEDLRPQWIVGSKTWPVAQNMGRLVSALAPKGLDVAARLRPAFDRAIHSAVHNAVDDRLKSDGYDARQRGEIEDLVEKSR